MCELPPPDKDVEKLIDNARNALLEHYSQKSTGQTAILVGLAVVLFADIQAVETLDKTLHVQLIGIVAFLTFSIGAIAFFILHAIGRLVFYGEQATQVLNADLLIDLDHRTYLSGLGEVTLKQASDQMKLGKSSAVSIVWKLTFSKYFKVFYLGLLVIVFLLLSWLLKLLALI